MGDQRENKVFLKTLANGLGIITLFNDRNPSMTLNELTKKSCLHRATVYRIVLTLEQLGYISREGKAFKLNPSTLNLGYSYLSSLPFFNIAHDLLHDLNKRIGLATSITVLDGEDVVYVSRIHAKRILSISLDIGSRLPAYATSTGHVLISGLRQEQIETYLTRSKRERITKKTLTERDDLKNSFKKTREKGYCVSEGWLNDGLISIAIPIKNSMGKTICAMNVVGNIFETSKSKLIKEILPQMEKTREKLQSFISAHNFS